ncbi:paraquat-inducible protein A [Methylolobus aquaticus]|nr:paraquat-inducible protein A [Methylolobus aquaticus]
MPNPVPAPSHARHRTPATTLAELSVVACLDCDAVYRAPRLAPGERASCARCGALLAERKRHGLEYPLALALTSTVLFVLANVYPLLRLNIAGRAQSGEILSSVHQLYEQGYWEVAALVFVVTIAAPLFRILSVLYVLGPLRMSRRVPGAVFVFRLVEITHPWAMAEVFMLGILVAIVKLADLATIQAGPALFAFAAMIVTMAATDASLDDQAVWEKLEHHS